MPKEVYEIDRRDDRQSQLEGLEVGESVAISRRLDITEGVGKETISKWTENLRGSLDQQTHRARRRRAEYRYTVENGSFTTRANGLVLVAVATRVE